MTSEAERDTPCEQWTKTRPLLLRTSSMKSNTSYSTHVMSSDVLSCSRQQDRHVLRSLPPFTKGLELETL